MPVAVFEDLESKENHAWQFGRFLCILEIFTEFWRWVEIIKTRFVENEVQEIAKNRT